MSMIKIGAFVLLLAAITAACSPASPGEPLPSASSDPSSSSGLAEPEVAGKLVIYSGRSEPLLQPVLEAFSRKYPAVEILLKAGSNSELANALIEEQANPQADVFIATELFTIQALAGQGIFYPYQPAEADRLPAGFSSPDWMWSGLTRRGRVIMYNTELVPADQAPKSIFDLTDPKWKGQVAAAGSTNGSMQAQIAALRQIIGDQAAEEWLRDLIANEVTFFGGHTDVRKAVGAGEFKLGLVNHYYYYLQQAEGSPVGMVIPDQGEGQIGLITNATAAALVKGARNLTAAQALLDFLLSEEGQKLFAEMNYEYPLLPGVPVREGVLSLEKLRLADVDLVTASQEIEATFDLMEKVGLP
jgi:iron(III) transport system substrate-binding protein